MIPWEIFLALKEKQTSLDAQDTRLVGLESKFIDWQVWTPTGLWNTNVTYTGAYCVINSTMFGYFKIAVSGGPPNTSSLAINLPSGYEINPTLLAADNEEVTVGNCTITDTGTAAYLGPITIRVGNSAFIRLKYSNVSGTLIRQNNVTQAVPFAINNSDFVRGTFWIPVRAT